LKARRSRRLAVLILALILLNVLPGVIHANGPKQVSAGSQDSDPFKSLGALWTWFVAQFRAFLRELSPLGEQPNAGTITLPPKTLEPSLPDPRAMEQEIFALINKERASAKPVPREPLVWDEKLASVARARAEEALATGEYTHILPSGSPQTALAKIGYLNSACENAGLRRSAAEQVQGWMHSPPHASNMLWPEARSVGVGVAVSKAPVKMHDEVHGGVYEDIHVAVYAIFYAGK